MTTKTKTPAKPKAKQPTMKIDTTEEIEGVEYDLVPRFKWVSKSAYGELLIRFKTMQKAFGNMFADREKIDKKYWALQKSFSELQEKNTALETAIDYKRKRVNEVSEENKALKEQYKNLKSSFSQLAEENKGTLDRLRILQSISNDNTRKGEIRETLITKLREENDRCKDVIKLNRKYILAYFYWAMIATAAFILSIIYILIH